MEGSTEIRKLSPGTIFGLVRILESGEAWKQLMAIVPKIGADNEDTLTPKYKVEHIKLIEQAGEKQRRCCAEIFLEEWSTSGRKRPDLSILLRLLEKAQLFRAADYITDLLKAPPLQRPSFGPAAPIDVSEEAIEKLVVKLPSKQPEPATITSQYHTDEINRNFEELIISDGNLPSLRSVAAGGETFMNTESERLAQQETLPLDQLERNASVPLNTTAPHIPYSELERCTNHFNELPVTTEGGRKLGTGAFGSVYLGILQTNKKVAVKKLNRDAVNIELQFKNEVETLSKFRHSNLLALMGFSCDSPTYCLVYEYMINGSLQDVLACKEQARILRWHSRLDIALGTAKGILYLHTAYEKPLIHRDIKSANILLDENLVPKLGDFGLVRLGQHQGNTTMTLTSTVLGTSAYMAPEAFRGDVSIKLDTFSFGVVILEILTGLPPYDEDREGHDLVTHVDAVCEEVGSIEILLDTQAGDWGREYVSCHPELSSLADRLYSIALHCIEDSKKKRPTMMTVVQWLEEMYALLSQQM